MKKEVGVYLEDILGSIEKILEYTAGLNFEDFNKNSEHQDSVMRRLAIIGEAVKNLPPEIREKYGDIPWKQIAGMRDVLIHEYTGVSLVRVWKVVTDDLAPLKKVVLEILKELK